MITQEDRHWLLYTIELSKNCPLVDTAFAVGAVLVDSEGKKIARGFSRETDPKVHAEEVALEKIAKGEISLAGATIYSSLEPCNKRLSKPHGCAELIIRSGIRRVVFAAMEPPLFVPGNGMQKLTQAGIEVIIHPGLTSKVIAAQSPLIQKKWRRTL